MNRAPEWTSGMNPVEGMAAHPSMQRKTTDELRTRLAQLEAESRESWQFDPSPLTLEYRRSLMRHREAILVALQWREEL